MYRFDTIQTVSVSLSLKKKLQPTAVEIHVMPSIERTKNHSDFPVLTELKKTLYVCIDNSASRRRIKMKHVPVFKLDLQQYNCENHIQFRAVVFA